MGASKTKQFTEKEIGFSLVGRALSHPARIAILDHLRKNAACRNTDLIPFLGLSKTTVHQHIVTLKDAGLVECRFMLRSSYLITLNAASIEDFSLFVDKVASTR